MAKTGRRLMFLGNISIRNKSEIIRKNDKYDFYQSKYDFYKKFTFWVVVLSTLISVSYFYSDCQILGGFYSATLLPRLLPLTFLAGYIIISKNFTDYRLMSILSLFILHAICLCTQWAVHYLPDKSHVNEGLLIVQITFFAIGFGIPHRYTTLSFILLYAEIMAACHINGYTDTKYIFSMGLPVSVGIEIGLLFLQKLYVSHYLMEQRLKMASVLDNLTNVYNRNYIRDFIEVKKEEIFVGPSSVIIFDIDHFKEVNDSLGHAAGDEILKWISTITMGNIRSTDYLIRWGGEEFVILLPNTSLADATLMAERLRERIQTVNNKIWPVTISAGVAPFIDNNIQHSVNLADTALYEAKGMGRNMVRTA